MSPVVPMNGVSLKARTKILVAYKGIRLLVNVSGKMAKVLLQT